MIKLSGTYADEVKELEYVCRVIPYGGKYYNGVGQLMKLTDGDVLQVLGRGTWFALYRQKDTKEKADPS